MQAAPPIPTDVTVTVDNGAIATVSDDPLLAGGASVTFFGVTTTSVGTVYVQGRLLGSTFLTVTAMDYNNGSANVTVDPSGFRIWSPTVINTTTVSPATTVQIRPVRLDPVTFNTSSNQPLRGGFPVNVDVTSSDLGVGTITISPLMFNANDVFMITAFQPIGVGTSTVTVVTPAGFDTPSNNQQITATVSP